VQILQQQCSAQSGGNNNNTREASCCSGILGRCSSAQVAEAIALILRWRVCRHACVNVDVRFCAGTDAGVAISRPVVVDNLIAVDEHLQAGSVELTIIGIALANLHNARHPKTKSKSKSGRAGDMQCVCQ
jgi:hypothetical protein